MTISKVFGRASKRKAQSYATAPAVGDTNREKTHTQQNAGKTIGSAGPGGYPVVIHPLVVELLALTPLHPGWGCPAATVCVGVSLKQSRFLNKMAPETDNCVCCVCMWYVCMCVWWKGRRKKEERERRDRARKERQLDVTLAL